MNIYLDNKIINDVTMSDAEISVYVALRSLYASNRKAQYISYNMLMYELFGNSDYKRAITDSVKSAFNSLVKKGYIITIEKLSTTEFILDLQKIYIDMDKDDTYYTVIYDEEVHTIMNISTKTDKMKLLRYFIICLRTICRTQGVYKDMNTKQNFVGFMSQEYLCNQIGVSYDSNAKLIQQYNTLLEDNHLLYIYRHTEMKRDKKSGKIKSFTNHYGRYSDRDDIDTFAVNYEKSYGVNEEIVQSDKANKKRSISAKYNNLCNDFLKYTNKYSDDELIEIYIQIHHDNELIEKEIQEPYVYEGSDYYDKLLDKIRDEDIFDNIPCVVEFVNRNYKTAS